MQQESRQDASWLLRETELSQADYPKHESLMALSNGYLSLRGGFEEETIQLGHAGTFLNGFYAFHPLHYGEKYSGFPDNSQVMLNLPDPKAVRLSINNQVFSLAEGRIIHFERELDTYQAHLQRRIVWEAPQGEQVEITSLRFVSATHKQLACLRYTVKALNFSGTLSLTGLVALDRHNLSREDDPRVGVDFAAAPYRITHTTQHEAILAVQGVTQNSGLSFRCYVAHDFSGGDSCALSLEHSDTQYGLNCQSTLQQGEALTLTKYIWYDRAESEQPLTLLQTAQAQGFEALLNEHRAWWQDAWQQMDIQIAGDESLQQALRFNMFHLTQAVGKDGHSNISAKGMTGEGYEGHYFWDTEIYMIPFFLYTSPDIARQLLMFRYHTLDQARARARELGHGQGALYPWRTINGEECSAYYPSGTAQYHINADIAYAIRLYYEVTGDRYFMENYGFEMLLELSKLWLDVGVFDPEKDNAFCIQEVTGPDEYTCLVNNNLYTNIMVKNQLEFTLNCYAADFQLSEQTQALAARFDQPLAQSIIERIYLPYSERLQIYAQDDSFLSRPIWDLAATPRDKFPLLIHYHPLTIYRHQVCKQADVVLAQMLLSDQFSLAQKRRDFAYYEKITTHDSSLSTCIYGIMAAELGDVEHSYNYYIKTARTDLDDTHHNAKDGIHAANMAGSWMGLVYGFAGMRLHHGMLKFAPSLPQAWQGYCFNITFRGQRITVSVTSEQVSYTLQYGDDLNITHHNEQLTLKAQQTRVQSL